MAQAQSATPVAALVLVNAANIQEMDTAAAVITAAGGQVRITFAPTALLVQLPPEAIAGVVGQAHIAAVYTTPVNADSVAAAFGESARLAAVAWNNQLSPQPSTQQDTLGMEPPHDVIFPPDLPQNGLGIASAPLSTQTSDFMDGSVQVDVFLLESNGTLDANQENWSSARRDSVVSEITAGLNWWATTATQGGRPGANLSFNISVHDPFSEPTVVATKYEPISRSSSDDDLWMAEIMNRLGYSGDAYTATRAYANVRRTSFNRNWGSVIFVVDSLNDSDGLFTNGLFAYASLYGPYSVQTYDNDGWGISRMDMVTAHETAHTFGALDEYASSGCTTSQRSGYLYIANTNCENGSPTENSIMRSASSQTIAFASHLASTPVRGMLGWRDSDSDGLYDVVDTTPSVSLTAYTPDPTSATTLTYQGSAQDVAYDSPSRFDATLNTITSAQYRVDGGDWQSCSAADGSFNSWSESLRCYPGPLTNGVHSVQIRAVNTVSNTGVSTTDTVTIDTIPPTNPTLVNSGCVTATVSNVWQNSCSDPSFTWSGATDATSGVSGYQYYWGTNAAGTGSTSISSAAYNPAAVSAGTYYLRLRTGDQAGNWSDWTTGYIFKYDNILPVVQIITPAQNTVFSTNTITIQATVTDTLSGPNMAQFYAWYDAGWHSLGYDTTSADGFSYAWDASAVTDQSDLALWVYAWDTAGNIGSRSIGGLTLDRTPPQTAVAELPAQLNSTTFKVNWSGSDNLTGLTAVDLQYKAGSGSWTNWYTNVLTATTSAWFTGDMGQTYYFRARGYDRAGNAEAYPATADAQVYLATCTGDGYEADDTYLQAQPIATTGVTQTHTFCGTGDADWLRFLAQANQRYRIETQNLPYWTDTYLFLYDVDGQTELAQNDDIVAGKNFASKVLWTAPADGYYYVKVRDWNAKTAGNDVTYDIAIAENPLEYVYLPLVIKTGATTTAIEPLPPVTVTPEKQGLIESPLPAPTPRPDSLPIPAAPPPLIPR